jgi:hypothetical protein
LETNSEANRIYDTYQHIIDLHIKDFLVISDDGLEIVGFCTYDDIQCSFSSLQHWDSNGFISIKATSFVLNRMSKNDLKKYPDPVEADKLAGDDHLDLLTTLRKRDDIVGWFVTRRPFGGYDE